MDSLSEIAKRPAKALRQVLQDFSDADIVTPELCELCAAQAPKDRDGRIGGPVPHLPRCAIPALSEVLPSTEALARCVEVLEAVLAEFDQVYDGDESKELGLIVEQIEQAQDALATLRTAASPRPKAVETGRKQETQP